ncbi:MAG: von Willebrand factor type A domain-containing protein [Planctomycetota bacterium]
MNEAAFSQPIEPEIEARIVAWVLGEASDFECEQLIELLEKRPDLVAFRNQIKAMHALMIDVGEGDPLDDSGDQEWKLSATNRELVLAAFRGEHRHGELRDDILSGTKLTETRTSTPLAGLKPTWTRRVLSWQVAKIAAVLVLGVTVSAALMVPALDSRSGGRGMLLHVETLAEAEMLGRDGVSSDVASIPPDADRFRFERDFESVDGEGADQPAQARGVVAGAPESRSSLSKNGQGLDHWAMSSGLQDKAAAGESSISKRQSLAPLLPDFAKSPGTERPELFGVVPPKDVGLSFNGVTNQPEAPAGTTRQATRGLRAAHEMLDPSQVETTTGGPFALGDRVAASESDASQPEPIAPSMGRQSERESAIKSKAAASASKESEELRYTELYMIPQAQKELTLPADPALRQKLVEAQRRFDARRTEAIVSERRVALGVSVNPVRDEDAIAGFGMGGGASGMETSGRLSPAPGLSRSAEQLSRAQLPFQDLGEVATDENAVSTFSLHVSDVSFKLARASLTRGEWPEAETVRIEEFVNAFDYRDPMPGPNEKVACHLEQSIHPFLQQRNLLRVSMRTAASGRSPQTPLRLTFLLDNSGSMERMDRRETVRRAFAMLLKQLTPSDQVTLISFARQPRLLADQVGAAHAGDLMELIEGLPSDGGTNIEAALGLAFEKAREQQLAQAQNRVVLLTDGAVNLGNANPESLADLVANMREEGIAFDAAGIVADGLNDRVLETLTRKGDGRYYLLGSPDSADDGFARQIAGALRPSAKNVKVQIEFNPQRVETYKLLGFEKHRLKKEDFRDDAVDAAELAAAEAGVALYHFQAKPGGEGDVGFVSVRFQDVSTGRMVEHQWPIPYQANAPRSDQAPASMRVATSAALLAAKLRGEPLGDVVELQTLSSLLADLPSAKRDSNRILELQQMIQRTRELLGE